MSHTITSRPWWLSHAVNREGKVYVARAQAVSDSLWPTDADISAGIACNKYDNSTECSGNPVDMFVDFTEAMLSDAGVTPGVLVIDYGMQPIDGARPKTNVTARPVSDAESQHVLALLETEGHCDDAERADNTPWQKGDDYAE